MKIRLYPHPYTAPLHRALLWFHRSLMRTDCCACRKRISTGLFHFLAPKNTSHGYCADCLKVAKDLLKRPTL